MPSGSGPVGARRLDNAAGRIGGEVYSHFRGVQQDGVDSPGHGGVGAAAVPGVPPADILQHVLEPDGLALSSRNRYLAPEERRRAAAFPAALRTAAENSSPREAIATATALITQGTGSAPEYVEVVDAETLEPLQTLDRPAVLAAAVKIGETRLIDNVRLAARHAKI